MDWKRVRCWWYGHKIVQEVYVVKDTKKYHGHDETRRFGKCKVCGVGTPQNELNSWNHDDYNLWERNHTTFGILIAVFAVVFVLALAAVPSVLATWKGCMDAGTQMNIPAKYSFWSGCYYQVDGRWIADQLLSVVDLLK